MRLCTPARMPRRAASPPTRRTPRATTRRPPSMRRCSTANHPMSLGPPPRPPRRPSPGRRASAVPPPAPTVPPRPRPRRQPSRRRTRRQLIKHFQGAQGQVIGRQGKGARQGPGQAPPGCRASGLRQRAGTPGRRRWVGDEAGQEAHQATQEPPRHRSELGRDHVRGAPPRQGLTASSAVLVPSPSSQPAAQVPGRSAAGRTLRPTRRVSCPSPHR